MHTHAYIVLPLSALEHCPILAFDFHLEFYNIKMFPKSSTYVMCSIKKAYVQILDFAQLAKCFERPQGTCSGTASMRPLMIKHRSWTFGVCGSAVLVKKLRQANLTGDILFLGQAY